MPDRPMSVVEYLDAEGTAAERHEYWDGSIIAQTGRTEPESLLITNLIAEAGNALKGKDCRVYDSNLKVNIDELNRYYYPDAFIVCGPSRHPPEDTRRTSVTNPTVIFEVLSDSTQSESRGLKFGHYLLLPSLREYVLVDQHEPSVQVFLRQGEGTWRMTFYRGLDAVAKLEAVEIELPLTEVYAGISFHPPASP